ncbi:hypothetical protein [Sphingomonas sp. CROZ-RG-20F-R02-07]|uniref:hypothetical protein n=1 Tax=Sphingomonas sp. CROZ-RG-20F-R02-07 TaxID=2914832 RepID=UPI001F5651DC|nr:hypothetical protein [Sphingomonas sp. CROZ-RG-20F-R02-07]
MLEIDLSGVAPLRRAETRRRIQTIRDYLNITNPSSADRDLAANNLGIGSQQFMNLVRAWRQGSAAAIAKAGSQAGVARAPRRKGLPPSTRQAAEDALRALPASASHKEAIAAVRAMCDERGTRPPSDSMISYLRLAIRRSGAAGRGDPGLVIGRAIVNFPVFENDGMIIPEIVISASSEDGRIISAALLRPGEPAPGDFEKATIETSSMMDGPVTVGADDTAFSTSLPRVKIVSRFLASRQLAKTLGRGIDGIRLSYGPLASTDPTRTLRADVDQPLSWREATNALVAASTVHNAVRGAPPPHIVDAGSAL